MKTLLIPIVWGIFILIASFWPSPDKHLPQMNVAGLDKWIHFTMYAVLSWLIFRSVEAVRVRKANQDFWILFILSIYGIAIECGQHLFFPTRHFEMLDIIANISGSIGGYLIFKILKRKNHG